MIKYRDLKQTKLMMHGKSTFRSLFPHGPVRNIDLKHSVLFVYHRNLQYNREYIDVFI
jgi:hypothetical protein